jgi:hypothetical protein
MTDWLKPENRLKATPLDLFRQGVVNRQWEAIDAAWVMLTGEPVFPTSTIVPVSESKKRGRPAKQKSVSPEISVPTPDTLIDIIHMEPEEESVHKIGTDGKIRNFGRKSSVGTHIKANSFTDDLTLEANEIKLSKEHGVPRKTPRRSPSKPIAVKCSNCGKTEKVDPVLAIRSLPGGYKMKYKCNDCICNNDYALDDDIVEE